MSQVKMTSCHGCFGSGLRVPTEPPWDKFQEGHCPLCDGLGMLNAVRADKTRPGDIFEDPKGRQWMKVRNEASGIIVATPQSGEGAGKPELFLAACPVQVIHRCDLAVFEAR